MVRAQEGDPVLDHPLLTEPRGALDRYVALLTEDQALRAAEYERPDPKRRRLKVACNDCSVPWCCNQRVTVEPTEALVIYRYAAEHAPVALAAALRRGADLHTGPPLSDDQFFRRKVACPFLVKGRCAIYLVRPYQCRCHYMSANPQKCRAELSPSETYEMNPDPTLLAELREIAKDVEFEHLIEGVRPTELSEVLLLVDRLVRRGPWSAPRELDWDLVE
jgi:Fe-S-cluster containining protein